MGRLKWKDNCKILGSGHSQQEIKLLAANLNHREEGSVLAVVLSRKMSFLLYRSQNVGKDEAWGLCVYYEGSVSCSWLRNTHSFLPVLALSDSLVYLSDVGSLWNLEVGCRGNEERMGVRFPPGQGWVGVCRATARRGRPTRAAWTQFSPASHTLGPGPLFLSLQPPSLHVGAAVKSIHSPCSEKMTTLGRRDDRVSERHTHRE